MKYLLTSTIVLLAVHFGFSQDKINGEKIVGIPEINIKTLLPFSSIKFIDQRFDTTKIGYVKTTTFNDFKKLITKQSFSQSLEEYASKNLSKNFDSKASQNLLIVIKKLWLQQTTIDELNNKKLTITSIPSAEVSVCTSAFDIYVQRDSVFIPLLKIDTNLFSIKKLYKDADYLLGYALENCLNRIATYDLNRINNRKSLSSEDVVKYNKSRMNYPRFKNDSLVKGIYITFKDFLNNKPLIKEFTIQSGKLTDELYIEENGNPILFKDFWGFCDGEKNYINLGFNFFELFRESNTYELWASKSITEKSNQYYGPLSSTGTAGGVFINAKRTKLNYKPLQLDMETGKLF